MGYSLKRPRSEGRPRRDNRIVGGFMVFQGKSRERKGAVPGHLAPSSGLWILEFVALFRP